MPLCRISPINKARRLKLSLARESKNACESAWGAVVSKHLSHLISFVPMKPYNTTTPKTQKCLSDFQEVLLNQWTGSLLNYHASRISLNWTMVSPKQLHASSKDQVFLSLYLLLLIKKIQGSFHLNCTNNLITFTTILTWRLF